MVARAFAAGTTATGYALGPMKAVLAGVLALAQRCVVSALLARLVGLPRLPEGASVRRGVSRGPPRHPSASRGGGAQIVVWPDPGTCRRLDAPRQADVIEDAPR